MSLTSTKSMKRSVGVAAANLIQDGMVVGIGSGSTSSCFLQALIDRCHQGLVITTVATSTASERQAQSGGILVTSIDDVPAIDLAVDGADEIDLQGRMIKGGGGALLREKIVAYAADEMVVIVDETKLVDKLGTFGLPIEVNPFGHTHTIREIRDELGLTGTLRVSKSGAPVVTDNANYTVDIEFQGLIDDPEELDLKLRRMPGVVETGLFLGLTGRRVIGYEDGHVEIRQ